MATIKRKINQVICDVCGADANGEWYSTEYLNGEVHAEYHCIADLCEKHMKVFANNYDELKYKQERYDSTDSSKVELLINELVDKIKEAVQSLDEEE